MWKGRKSVQPAGLGQEKPKRPDTGAPCNENSRSSDYAVAEYNDDPHSENRHSLWHEPEGTKTVFGSHGSQQVQGCQRSQTILNGCTCGRSLSVMWKKAEDKKCLYLLHPPSIQCGRDQRRRETDLRCRWWLRHWHGARLWHDRAPHGRPGEGVLGGHGGSSAGHEGRGCRWTAGKSIGYAAWLDRPPPGEAAGCLMLVIGEPGRSSCMMTHKVKRIRWEFDITSQHPASLTIRQSLVRDQVGHQAVICCVSCTTMLNSL